MFHKLGTPKKVCFLWFLLEIHPTGGLKMGDVLLVEWETRRRPPD